MAAPTLPIPIPVTDDNTCEFGFKGSAWGVWDNPEVGGNPENYVRAMLRQAIKYCAAGSLLTIGFQGKNAIGIPHDQYSVAALLCKRPDIQERHFPGGTFWESWVFTCRIDPAKFEKLQERESRREALWNRKEEFVPPRPGDDFAEEARLKVLGLWKPPAAASKPVVSPTWGLK